MMLLLRKAMDKFRGTVIVLTGLGILGDFVVN